MLTKQDAIALAQRTALDEVGKRGAKFKSLADPWCDTLLRMGS
jgi:hypothetical protein